MRGHWIAACLAAVAPGALAGASSGPAAAAAPVVADGFTVSFLPSAPIQAGRSGRIAIRLANGWGSTARGVTLVVVVPSWVRIAATGCRPRSGGGVTCSLPDLAARRSTVVRLTLTPTRLGTYRIVARASAEALAETSPVRTPSAALPAFRVSIAAVGARRARAMTGVSWRPGCPVALADLRVLRVSHWGFDGRAHTGVLVVHRQAAAALARVFRRLFALRFPIRRMEPVDAFGGSDFRSIEADNTSAFNCRPVAGTSRWSEHAYGRAIDLNPLENPYVSGGRTAHPGSRRYLDRSLRLPGTIHAGDAVVRAFAEIGWGWGGSWTGDRDYQHFSSSGG
ncbi:MAG TPA: M15 family metallopeptidase [Gaiellaceae bacterium]|nr:M15 family metallopeptidase [Gaiellaceae bacterium]